MLLHNGCDAPKPVTRLRCLTTPLYRSSHQYSQLEEQFLPIRRSQYIERPYVLRSYSSSQDYSPNRIQQVRPIHAWRSPRVLATSAAAQSDVTGSESMVSASHCALLRASTFAKEV